MSIDYADPLSRGLMEDCPSLSDLDWELVSPQQDGASLVYGWAATASIEQGNADAIYELAAHLNRIFEVGDEAQTTAATVGALESWAMTKCGVATAQSLLKGEALRWFERQTEWIKAQ